MAITLYFPIPRHSGVNILHFLAHIFIKTLYIDSPFPSLRQSLTAAIASIDSRATWARYFGCLTSQEGARHTYTRISSACWLQASFRRRLPDRVSRASFDMAGVVIFSSLPSRLRERYGTAFSDVTSMPHLLSRADFIRSGAKSART